MKNKNMFLVAMVLCSCIILSGCCLSHEWQDAACTQPKTCVKCGRTRGEPLGHTWLDATCIAPKTCEICSVTEGTALGHDWEETTCVQPKHCRACQETEGIPLPHDSDWKTVESREVRDQNGEKFKTELFVGNCRCCGNEVYGSPVDEVMNSLVAGKWAAHSYYDYGEGLKEAPEGFAWAEINENGTATVSVDGKEKNYLWTADGLMLPSEGSDAEPYDPESGNGWFSDSINVIYTLGRLQMTPFGGGITNEGCMFFVGPDLTELHFNLDSNLNLECYAHRVDE